MTPWLWRLGAGVSALGACTIAPLLASGLILFSLGLPISGATPGLWYDYWQVLERPAYRPYATRILCWGGTGLLLPPLLWCGAMLWFRRHHPSIPSASPHVPFDDLATSELELPALGPGRGAIPLTRRRGRTRAAPHGASVLVSAPFYPEAHAVVIHALRRSSGATLVIDCGGRSHVYARKARGRTVLRIDPFDGDQAWNPLAGAWRPEGLDANELRQIATLWLPERGPHDRFMASHARNAFVSLVYAVDDVLRRTGSAAVPVAPGDLHRLCARWRSYASPQAFLQALARRPEIGARARIGMSEWRGLGEEGADTIWARVSEVLAPFADPVVDAATRGGGLPDSSLRKADVYMDVPDRWRAVAGPLIDSAIRQWQNAPGIGASSLLVVHALDALPRIAALTDPATAGRCIATTRGIAALHARYGDRASALDRRFALCVVQAPRDDAFAAKEARALKTFMADHRSCRHVSEPASVRELMSLRRGQQIVAMASLPTPVICRTLNLPRKPSVAPPQTDHGEAMPISRSFIAFLATLVATSVSAGGTSAPAPAANPQADPERHARLVGATIGHYKFAFPKNLYYQQSGPDPDGGVMLLVQWPTLKPLPQGVDYHAHTVDFISHISISIAAPSRLSDAAYRTLLRRYVEPLNPDDKKARANPSQNLDLRIKGEPTFGLTPYLADSDKLKHYYENLYGPGTSAGKPERHDEWFVRMGADGVPTTVITCSSRFIPDGASIQDGRIVDGKGGRRSTCNHSFLIPELRLIVDLSYLRIVMPDWQRIENRVRTMIESGMVR
jgi:hypothetical protein